jgi:hypothetical protein
MSNLTKINQFDHANYDLAKRVLQRPNQYQRHLHLWAEGVIRRLGTPEERAELEARTGLYASIAQESI